MTMTQHPMPAPTALLPLDPAVSPQHALRILPIRANLLPEEITAGRNARRTRTVLIIAVVLTIAGLGGWYAYAVQQRTLAEQDLAGVTRQVDDIRQETKSAKYTKVTETIEQRDVITGELKNAMGSDLPWNALFDKLRTTGVKNVTITEINGTLEKATAASNTGTPASAKAIKKVAKLTLQGTAKDKRTIAAYLDAAAQVKGVSNVYLTIAVRDGSANMWKFSVNADVTTDRLCGRFTTTCKDGAK